MGIAHRLALALLLFVLALAPLQATSVGVSPPKTELWYRSGQTDTVTVHVLNREGYKEYAKLSLTGDYAQHASIPEQNIQIAPSGRTPVQITITHPINPPENGAKVNLGVEIQANPEYYRQSGAVGAIAGFLHPINVRVPKEGRFMSMKFTPVASVNSGEIVYFTLAVENYGSEPIDNVIASITITDSEGRKVGAVTTGTIDLLTPGAKRELYGYWESGQTLAGAYTATATIDYGGATPLQSTQGFHIGDLLLRIANVDFTRKGPIIQANAMVQSEWNDPITDVYSEVQIRGTNGIIAEGKSTSETIAPRSARLLTTFIDSTGMLEGKYTAHVRVHYHGKIAEMIVPYSHTEEDLSGSGITEVHSGPMYFSMSQLLILLLVVILGNGLLFILLGRQREK